MDALVYIEVFQLSQIGAAVIAGLGHQRLCLLALFFIGLGGIIQQRRLRSGAEVGFLIFRNPGRNQTFRR